MVDVRVGADDGQDFQFVASENFYDALDLVAGIYDDCFVRFRIAQDRTVALQHSDRNYFVN